MAGDLGFVVAEEPPSASLIYAMGGSSAALAEVLARR